MPSKAVNGDYAASIQWQRSKVCGEEDSLDRMILVRGTAVEEEKATSLFCSLAISVTTYHPGE